MSAQPQPMLATEMQNAPITMDPFLANANLGTLEKASLVKNVLQNFGRINVTVPVPYIQNKVIAKTIVNRR